MKKILKIGFKLKIYIKLQIEQLMIYTEFEYIQCLIQDYNNKI